MSEADLTRAAAYNRQQAALDERLILSLPRGSKRRQEARARRDLWLQLANEIDQYLAGQHALQDQDPLL